MRDAMLESLVSFIYGRERADGLESILFTLIHDAHSRSRKVVADQATRIWSKFGTTPTRSGAGPLIFYNVETKRMSYFKAQTARAIISHPTDPATLAEKLDDQAVASIQDMFSATPTDHVVTEHRFAVLAERQGGGQGPDAKRKAHMHLAKGIGELIVAGVGILSGGPVIVIIIVGLGGALAASVDIIEALQEEGWVDGKKPVEKPTSGLDRTTIPVEDPNDLIESVHEGMPVVTEDDRIGTQDAGDPFGNDTGIDQGEGCFIGSTPVWMADDTVKAIEDVAPGDYVMSRGLDGSAGNLKCRVSKVHRLIGEDTMDLLLSDGSVLTTTPRQRISLKLDSQGDSTSLTFIEASKLYNGIDVETAADGGLKVESSTIKPGPVPVFNLTVDSAHTYFVGSEKVLVHNRKTGDPGPSEPPDFLV
jgi:hypothetical protein